MRRVAWVLMVSLMVCLSTVAWSQEKSAFLWNGTHWSGLSFDAKVGFIKGMGNLADMEASWGVQGRKDCISNAFIQELKTKTIEQIIQEVDKFYQDNPDKVNQSVIEVVLKQCSKGCPPEHGVQEKKQ